MAASVPARAERFPAKSDEEASAIVVTVLRAIVEDEASGARSASLLFQDFAVRCRMAGLAKPPLDLPDFTRRLSMARAGIYDVDDGGWHGALDAARALPDDMLGPFLLVARAARDGAVVLRAAHAFRFGCVSRQAISAAESFGPKSVRIFSRPSRRRTRRATSYA